MNKHFFALAVVTVAGATLLYGRSPTSEEVREFYSHNHGPIRQNPEWLKRPHERFSEWPQDSLAEVYHPVAVSGIEQASTEHPAVEMPPAPGWQDWSEKQETVDVVRPTWAQEPGREVMYDPFGPQKPEPTGPYALFSHEPEDIPFGTALGYESPNIWKSGAVYGAKILAGVPGEDLAAKKEALRDILRWARPVGTSEEVEEVYQAAGLPLPSEDSPPASVTVVPTF